MFGGILGLQVIFLLKPQKQVFGFSSGLFPLKPVFVWSLKTKLLKLRFSVLWVLIPPIMALQALFDWQAIHLQKHRKLIF